MAVPTAWDHTASGYSLPHAYWMAQAADLAYKDPAEVEARAHHWGFDRVRHLASPHAMPFPIEDTQAYVMGSDRMVVAAFRGTEPTQIRDWLSDATTPPVPGPGGTGFVHHGFNQALASVYPEVRDTVAGMRTDGQTVRHFDADGKLHDRMPVLAGLADRAKGLTADPLAPASDGLRDHPMKNYPACLEKNLARTP
ncbi:hypothetical protein OG948_40125 (plasmid) [Embleya sp. NBC_00888]|uniref:hypothetical protein n=1 Tax=Embleya sp. NBC_00888 TaxID=2975960 RepID=UPI002F91A11F|nr:hypothetical protein OG948_40125 [Embleya sp. NBC_00888]